MEKYSFNKSKTILPLERHPEFGTTCSIMENSNYFVLLRPSDKQIAEIKNCNISFDANYSSKEIFHIFMNSVDEINSGT